MGPERGAPQTKPFTVHAVDPAVILSEAKDLFLTQILRPVGPQNDNHFASAFSTPDSRFTGLALPASCIQFPDSLPLRFTIHDSRLTVPLTTVDAEGGAPQRKPFFVRTRNLRFSCLLSPAS